jgi:hypothetical protein
MWNRTNLFVCIVCLTYQLGYGQNTDKSFKGVIIAAQNKTALANVVCKSFDRNNKMLTYGFSDTNGRFVLKNVNGTVAFLVFECLGYKQQKIDIKDIKDISDIKIHLNEDVVALKEITVTAPPVQRRNDTIIYNVSSFEGQEDRYLVDILKKLPGITVSENGTVSYQGESINKFYIEGHDLLGRQYGLATNNITKDAVSQVQVLENHQPVKALKDIKFSDKAALNIKLKKGYLLKPFGEIKAGVGANLSPSLLYDEKLFVAQIGGQVQTLVNLRMNNVGIDLSDEYAVKAGGNIDVPPSDIISSDDIRNLPVNLKRYLFNDSYAGSMNNLIALSKDTELKLNFSYTNDRVNQNFTLRNTYATETDELVINQLESQTNRTTGYLASISLEHNSSDKYLRNELKSTGKWSENHSAINTDTENQKKRVNIHPLNFQNDFHGLIKLKNNKTVSINSYARYLDKSEIMDLTFTKILDSSILNESFLGDYFYTNNSIATSFDLFRQRFGIEFNIEYKSDKTKSKLSDFDIPNLNYEGVNFSNINNRIDDFQSAVSFSYEIRKKNSVTNITLPLAYKIYTVWNLRDKSLTDSRIIPSPSIRNVFKINNQFEFMTGLRYQLDYGDCFPLLDYSFFRSHRVIYIPSGIFGKRGNYSASAGMKYNNLPEMFFFNLIIIYGINRYSYISKTFNTPNWSYYTTEAKNNTGTQLSLNANISKSFIPVGLALTVTPNLSQVKSTFIQQNILMKNKGYNGRLSLKLEYKNIKNTNIACKTTGGVSWNDNDLMTKMVLKNLQQNVTFYYFPQKNIDISAHFDYTLYEIEKNRYSSNYFLDLKCRYKYKRLEFEFSANNIFDNDIYSLTRLSSVNSIFQSLPMRGREFLLSANMKF